MKLISRIVSIFLIAAMAFTAISCAESKDNGADTVVGTIAGETETEAETVFSDNLPDNDLEGFSLNIAHFDQTWLAWANNALDAEEMTGELLNDEIYNRNEYIKDRFNCELGVTSLNMIDNNFVMNLVSSGDTTYDVIFQYDLWLLNSVTYLMPWNDIPYLDLSQSWWNPDATDVFNIGGKQFAVSGSFSLSVTSRAAGYIFNKDLFTNLNTGIDMYALARDGKWTLDKFYEIGALAVSDIDGDGNFTDADQYGMSGSVKEHFTRLLLGSGISYITKDEDGWLVFSLPYDETAIQKMSHILELNTDGLVYYNTLKGNIDSSAPGDHFKTGHTLFTVGPVFSLESMRDYEQEIGILPVPMYDEAQGKYYAPSFGAEVASLPASFDMERAENVGLILEAIAIHSERNLLQTYKEVMIKTKYTRDVESEEMLDIIFSNISFEFGINAWQDSVTRSIMKIYDNRTDTIVSTLTSMEKSINRDIDKLREKIEGMQ